MNSLILIEEVNKNYQQIRILKIKRYKSCGIMNNIFVGYDNKHKYIIKIYKSKMINKILSEHVAIRLVKKFSKNISYFKNKLGKTYTFSNELNVYFGVYKYKEGIIANHDANKLKEISLSLSNFHSFSKKLRLNKNIIDRNIVLEFNYNIKNLKKSLLMLNKKKKLNKKEFFVKNIILKKLKELNSYDLKNDLKILAASSKGLIHGDFVPQNIIFKGNKISGILDWENSCKYNYVWEIFRSICQSSKIGSKGLICSKLNISKVDLFLKLYIGNNFLDSKNIMALKLMPKYYYFLDTYIITNYVIGKNKILGKLISNNISDHFWLEDHYDQIKKLISKYEK